MKVKKWITYLCIFLVVFFIRSNINENELNIPNKNFPPNSKEAIKVKIIREAKKQGLNPMLAISVAKQESDFERRAKSYAGAIGVFQLMPATAKDLGVNPWHTDQNIKGGIKYLKTLKDEFGSTRLALAAYNAGPGAVKRYGGIPPYRETRNYVKNIMNYYSYYSNNPDAVMVE